MNLQDDQATAIKGVLWSSRGAWLTFRDCSLLKASQPPTTVDGEIVIHRSKVAFLQVP